MHPYRQLVIDRSIASNKKITDEHVLESKTLQQVAIDYIKEYKGDNRFIHRLKYLRKVTHKQCRAVLNIMIDEHKPVVIVNRNPIPDGRYTVLFGDHEYTLRISEYEISDHGNKYKVPIGTQSAMMLIGPDNSNDYSPIGFIYPNRQFKIRHTLKDNDTLINAVNVLLGDDDPIKFGEAYTLKSSRCWRCGRDLTKAKSIIRGLGPHCAKILGIHDESHYANMKPDKVDPNMR